MTAEVIRQRDAAQAALAEAEAIADDRKRRHAIESKRGALLKEAADAEAQVASAQFDAQKEYDELSAEHERESERAVSLATELLDVMDAAHARRDRLDRLARRAERHLSLSLPRIPTVVIIGSRGGIGSWNAFIVRWRSAVNRGWSW